MVESLDKDIEKALNDINVVIIKDEEIEENRNADGALGHGTFGTVRKGLLNKSTEVAIKELIFNSNEQTSDEVVKDILNEIKAFSIGEKLHPAIVKFFGVWKQSSRICFIFELIDGTDLNKICGKMDLKTKLQVIIEICDVLGTLHNAKLIHRDIKPSNVMIDNKTGKVRIIDFGTVKIAKNENTFTVNQKGTDNYMSPELIKIIELDGDDENDVAHFGISPKVDVWAVGCLISEIFTGIIPWQNLVGPNSSAVRKHLLKKTMFPIPEELKDEKIIKLIKMAVEIDLDKRCTASELKEATENYLKEC